MWGIGILCAQPPSAAWLETRSSATAIAVVEPLVAVARQVALEAAEAELRGGDVQSRSRGPSQAAGQPGSSALIVKSM